MEDSQDVMKDKQTYTCIVVVEPPDAQEMHKQKLFRVMKDFIT